MIVGNGAGEGVGGNWFGGIGQRTVKGGGSKGGDRGNLINLMSSYIFCFLI